MTHSWPSLLGLVETMTKRHLCCVGVRTCEEANDNDASMEAPMPNSQTQLGFRLFTIVVAVALVAAAAAPLLSVAARVMA